MHIVFLCFVWEKKALFSFLLDCKSKVVKPSLINVALKYATT